MLQVRLDGGLPRRQDLFLEHPDFVVRLGFPLFDTDGATGAVSQAGSQTITKEIAQKSGLAVYQPYRTFGTVGNAVSTAITKRFINPDKLAFHPSPPLRFHQEDDTEWWLWR